MKTIALVCGVAWMLSARVASADINQFTVKLSPELAHLWYESPGLVGGDLGCAEGAFQCAFGLDMEMAFAVDSSGLAQATVSKVEISGNEAALAQHPGFREYLENSVQSLFTNSDFAVERGPASHQTALVANFPMSDNLRLEFDRARLVSMSGGADMRPVDGAKFSFAYAVPEPSALGLALISCVTALGWAVARRFRRDAR